MATLFVSGFDAAGEGRIVTLDARGRLGTGGVWPAGSGATYLATYTDARGADFVYSANRDATGAASAAGFAVARGGVPVPLGAPVDAHGASSCHVTVHPTGRWVLVCNWLSGTLAVLPRGDDGRLGPASSVLAPGRHTHQVVFARGGTRALVPVMGDDAVIVYAFDAGTGALEPLARYAAPAGSGPRHAVLGAGEDRVFLVSEVACTVTSLAFDAATGALAPLCTASALPPGTACAAPAGAAAPAKAAAIALTADGRHMYAGIRGGDACADGVAAFRVSTSADLTPIGYFDGTQGGGGGDSADAPRAASAAAPLRMPRDMTLDASSAFLLVASQLADAVTSFRVEADGTLTVVDRVVLPGSKPTCVRCAPGGGTR